MLRDLVGSLFAAVVFTLPLYAPGYLFGALTNFFGFRRLNFAAQSLWAIAASFCISPIVSHLAGRVFGLVGVCWLFGLAGVTGLVFLLRLGRLTSWTKSDRALAVATVMGWDALVLLLLVDFISGHKLYYSVVMADQSYRIAFTEAVVRTGIPPSNPLYFAGSPALMRYYYFWYVLCAAVVRVGHVSARQAFIGSSIWAGLGLTVAVKLYATELFRWSRKTVWIAIGLLLVTGADLLPALGNLFLQSSMNGNSEWWSVDQIDAWPDSVLWVPHHVAAVLCCLFALLVLWKGIKEPDLGRTSLMLLAGTACASAFGLSVYVAVGFAILMAAWLVRLVVAREEICTTWIRLVLRVSLVSTVLLIPFLRELLKTTSASSSVSDPVAPGHLLRFSVRPLIDSSLVTSLPALSTWNHAHPLLLDQVVRLLLLIPGLAMELGIYGAVLFFVVRDRRFMAKPLTSMPRAAVFFAAVGLVMTVLLTSSVITNNDFGYRAVMLPQFFLLLLTAQSLGEQNAAQTDLLFAHTVRRRRTLATLLILGVAGTLYWAVLLRAWLPLTAVQASGGFAKSPDDAYQVRDAFERFDRIAPQNAVVAFRDMDLDVERKDMEVMTPTEYFQRMLVMDTGRQIFNAEPKCATHFGGDPVPCTAMKKATQMLYATPSLPAQAAQEYCRQFRVDYLLFTVRDPGWPVSSGWADTLPVVVSEPRLKILHCTLPVT